MSTSTLRIGVETAGVARASVILEEDYPPTALADPAFGGLQPFFPSAPGWRRYGGRRSTMSPPPAAHLSGEPGCRCAPRAGRAARPICPADPALNRESAFPAALDLVVDYANRCSVFGVRYKPYWLMCDLATLAALVVAWAFSRRFPEVSGLGLGLGVLAALAAHKIVLEVKAALGRVASRSFLQDCLLIIIPTFLAISAYDRQPLDLTFAFLGLLLPLYGGLARIGCFLGGCCYGKPYRYGVLYPDRIFSSQGAGWRRYSPSPNPQGRVLPTQLVEAAAQLTLFAILALPVWREPASAQYVFPLYLFLYAIVRFVLDCFRTASARPRHGRFSEAQLVCAAVAALASFALAYMVAA
jgi:phosphatidylglycerol---prolipoprotein diacylglyceryl transferase